ncbi:MAG: hypothetical protein ACUVRD_04685 [Bacteroidia bacterium]
MSSVSFLGWAVAYGVFFLWSFLAITLCVVGYYVYRSYQGSLYLWIKPSFGKIGALLYFVAMGFLLLLGIIYAAALSSPPFLFSTSFWKLALIFVLWGLVNTGLTYVGLRSLCIVGVKENEILLPKLQLSHLHWELQRIPWSEIYDYYTHEEGGITRFTFLTRKGERYAFELPYTAKKKLESFAEYSIEKYRLLQRYSRYTQRPQP